MGKFKLSISMSIDGYVAGPDQSEANPLGDRRKELKSGWFHSRHSARATVRKVARSTRARRSPKASSATSEPPSWAATCSVAGPDRGATTPGRGGGETTRPSTRPVFVLTHHAREPLELQGEGFFLLRHGWNRVGARAGPGSRRRQGRAHSVAVRALRSSMWRRVCSTRSWSRSSP